MSNKKKIKPANKNIKNYEEYDYAFLFPGKEFSQNFLMSWTNTVNHLISINKTFFYSFKYSPIISTLRNQMVLDFGTGVLHPKMVLDRTTKPFQGKLKVKKVIFIDSDMVWSVEDLMKIIESPHDIAVGPYALTDPSFSSVREKDEEFFISSEDIKNKKSVFNIESAGLGFTAINFEIFEKVEYPWFGTVDYFYENNGERYQDTIGEDVFFFRRVREHGGFSIVADPSINLGHEKMRVITF